MRILVIDNYDSFVYNLVQYLGELGATPVVYRNDAIDIAGVKTIHANGIVISPGPGNPTDRRYFGINVEILKEISPRVPTLGICLGHQGIGAAFGGRVVGARQILHGKTSRIYHDGTGLFEEVPNGFLGARYHSLVLDRDTLSDDLVITAESDDGEIMGVQHCTYPIAGLQFHPESILTEHGKRILANFLRDVDGGEKR
ncbi:MAG: anthranilate synthase component II [Candidatus Bipolaricaulia bacterium]